MRLVDFRYSTTQEVLLFVEATEYDPGAPGLHIETPTTDGVLLDRAEVEKLRQALSMWLEACP